MGTISKIFFATHWLLSLVCNKQSKREIKFHETRRKKNIHNTTKKNYSNRSFWGTQTCPKNAQQRWFLHNICPYIFFFFSCFSVCFFALCLSSIKVQILWEGHKIWKNLPPPTTISQIFVAFSEKLNFTVVFLDSDPNKGILNIVSR
jgi:hypothetical protein